MELIDSWLCFLHCTTLITGTTQGMATHWMRRAVQSHHSTRAFSTTTQQTTLQQKPRILITGGEGQIGTELKGVLQRRYGIENVLVSDIRKPSKDSLNNARGQFLYLDVLDEVSLARVVVENSVDWVIHNSSLLSAVGENNPLLAMKVNVQGLQNVLEVARKYDLKVFVPSSIAAFGPTTPRDNTPDLTIMRPTTIYGVTKGSRQNRQGPEHTLQCTPSY